MKPRPPMPPLSPIGPFERSCEMTLACWEVRATANLDLYVRRNARRQRCAQRSVDAEARALAKRFDDAGG